MAHYTTNKTWIFRLFPLKSVGPTDPLEFNIEYFLNEYSEEYSLYEMKIEADYVFVLLRKRGNRKHKITHEPRKTGIQDEPTFVDKEE